MSREGARGKEPPPPAGKPIWVWLIYGAGALGAVALAFALLFALSALVLPDGVEVAGGISTPATILWGALIVVAVVTWLVRRGDRS